MAVAPSIPDFALLRRIGGGGYGEVWLGRGVTGVLRAIKIIDRARFDDDRPFFRELDGITRFQQGVGDQPRQLALLHVGRNEHVGLFYYVMELADDAVGGTTIDPATYVPLTLKELRTRRHWLPAADCVRIGTELAIALGELHKAGLLHRDVKPSNVIFVAGRAKLADIGLIASSESTVSSVGTPEYAAPEGTGSIRADLYSLGKILHELATGLGPDEFPRLPADLPGRPDAAALIELNEIILRASHSDPTRRYPHAEALLSDLRLLQAGRSVQELNRTRRQLRTLSWVGAIASACALVVIGVLGVRNYFALRALAAQETAFRKSAEADERLARYVSDMHFAQLGLVGGDLGAARTALRRQIPKAGETDLRGIEWYALWNHSEGRATRTLGDVGGPPVTALALSPDGRSLATIERASPSRAVIVDLNTSRRRVLAEDCHGLAGFSADGSRLIITTGDKTVCTVDLTTGAIRRQGMRGRFVAGLNDGRTVLLVNERFGDDTLFFWDAETEARIYEWTPESAHTRPALVAAAASQDRRLIAAVLVSTDGAKRFDEVLIRDTRSDVDVGRISTLSVVTALRFSRDGTRLAIAAGAEAFIAPVSRLNELRRVASISDDVALDFCPDGSRLAIGGSDRLLSVLSLDGGDDLIGLEGHESAIRVVTWTADGRRLLTASQDGTCRIWNPGEDPMRSVVTDQWAADLGSAVLSSDGAMIAVTNGTGNVVVMRADRMSSLFTLRDAFHPLAFVEDGRSLLSLSHDHVLIRSSLRHDSGPAAALPLAADSRIMSFSVSPNKRFVALGLNTGDVQVWDLQDLSNATKFRVANREVTVVAIASDGRTFAAGDLGGDLRLVSTASGLAQKVPVEGTIVTGLGFSTKGGLLAVGNDRGFLFVWDMIQKEFVAKAQAHSAEIDCVLFATDESRLLSGGADGLIVAWTTRNWRPLAAWSVTPGGAPSQHGIYRLEMDERGSRLIAMTSDGVLQRWNCSARPTATISRSAARD